MEHQKTLNLLNEKSDSKFVNDQSNANYDTGNEIIYNKEVLKSNLCDYNYVCIIVRGNITVTTAPATQGSFKFCAPFTKCITKFDGTAIVLPMCNLIEYSSNYSETRGILWFYSKDETTNFNAGIANNNNFKSFKYKAKLSRKTVFQPSPN